MFRRRSVIGLDEVSADEGQEERGVLCPEQPPRRVSLSKHLDGVELHRNLPARRQGRSGHRQEWRPQRRRDGGMVRFLGGAIGVAVDVVAQARRSRRCPEGRSAATEPHLPRPVDRGPAQQLQGQTARRRRCPQRRAADDPHPETPRRGGSINLGYLVRVHPAERTDRFTSDLGSRSSPTGAGTVGRAHQDHPLPATTRPRCLSRRGVPGRGVQAATTVPWWTWVGGARGPRRAAR